jgi:chromosome segregation ATPase
MTDELDALEKRIYAALHAGFYRDVEINLPILLASLRRQLAEKDKRLEQWSAAVKASQAEADRMRSSRDDWTKKAEDAQSALVRALCDSPEPDVIIDELAEHKDWSRNLEIRANELASERDSLQSQLTAERERAEKAERRNNELIATWGVLPKWTQIRHERDAALAEVRELREALRQEQERAFRAEHRELSAASSWHRAAIEARNGNWAALNLKLEEMTVAERHAKVVLSMEKQREVRAYRTVKSRNLTP